MHHNPEEEWSDRSRGHSGPARRPGRGFGGIPGFGPGFPFGPGGPAGFGEPGGPAGYRPGPRGRSRRGQVRQAILALLAEAPMNGYQIMQAIEQRSNGTWKPSSGSIYPTLQLLADEDLVATEAGGQSGSTTYKLSAKGKRYVDDHKDELAADWLPTEDDAQSANPKWELMMQVRQITMAVMQVAQTGTQKQIDEAKKLLAETRRGLYRMLADDDSEE